MPKDYERRKREELRKGKSLKEAKRSAAIRTVKARKKAGKPAPKFHRGKKRKNCR